MQHDHDRLVEDSYLKRINLNLYFDVEKLGFLYEEGVWGSLIVKWKVYILVELRNILDLLENNSLMNEIFLI